MGVWPVGLGTWDLIWAVAPFALSMTASPGPSNIMATATATNFGLARTVPQILGFPLGLGTMILAMGIGLGQVLDLFPFVHDGLKVLGTAYLLYLGWRIARASAPDVGGTGKPLSFVEAALFQIINPKAWIAAFGAVTTYTVADAAILPQVLTLSAVFVLIGMLAVSAWALFGQAAARLLRSPGSLRLFNFTMAGLLVASIITLFV